MEYTARKHPRLSNYDYSAAGAYFITICTQNRKRLFSDIEKTDENPPLVQLTAFGKIAEDQLFQLEERYPFVRIGCFVIMPDHIHVLIQLISRGAEENPRTDLNGIICAYKSLVVRQIQNEYRYYDKIFQTSYFEHVLRNRQDYEETEKYIRNNPVRWYFKNRI
ncbi:MAG: transposase [Clostridia bacterium]|nr:transposase [Clostridia bacterium]